MFATKNDRKQTRERKRRDTRKNKGTKQANEKSSHSVIAIMFST